MRVLTPRIEEKATIAKVSVETATEEGRAFTGERTESLIANPTLLLYRSFGDKEAKEENVRNPRSLRGYEPYGCPE